MELTRARPSSVQASLEAAAELVAAELPAGGGPAEAADLLYARWYLQPRTSAPASGPVAAIEADPVAALRAAHAGTERFSPGWRARRVSTRGRAEAVRGGEVRVLDRGDYVVPARPGLRAEPGDELLACDRVDHVEDGFWVTYLGRWDAVGEAVLTRVYWRIAPTGAPALVSGLTAGLLDAGVPAAVKVALEPAGRADAAVAYVRSADWPALVPDLQAVAGRVARHLSDPPPALTLRLAEGIGVAEGRAGEESFGQRRCRLVAGGALAGGAGGARAALAAAGLDADRPHLEPGSLTHHAW